MSLDAAGNYLFQLNDGVDNSEYRILKMHIIAQREFLGIAKNAFIEVVENIKDEEGNIVQETSSELDIYSEGCNKAEDYLFERTQVKDGVDSWIFLNRSNMAAHFEKIEGRTPIISMNRVFTAAISSLLENFTGTGAKVSLLNSNQAQEGKSERVSLASQLSKTSS